MASADCVSVQSDVRGDDMLVVDRPGSGVTNIVMMAWERPYMEALVCALDVTEKDDVLEIGFGLGLSARAIRRRGPRRHVVVECAPKVLTRVEDFDVVADTWQNYCATSESTFSAVLFDDFPLPPDPGPLERWPAFLSAVQRLLRPGARITGYLAHTDALLALPAGFRLVSVDAVHVSPPPDCTYHGAEDACLAPVLVFEPQVLCTRRCVRLMSCWQRHRRRRCGSGRPCHASGRSADEERARAMKASRLRCRRNGKHRVVRYR